MTQKIDPKVFEGKVPEMAASMLLQHFGGDARKAEVEAWKFWELYAGGEVGKRPRADSEGARYFGQVVRAITDETELPSVPRINHRFAPRKRDLHV